MIRRCSKAYLGLKLPDLGPSTLIRNLGSSASPSMKCGTIPLTHIMQHLTRCPGAERCRGVSPQMTPEVNTAHAESQRLTVEGQSALTQTIPYNMCERTTRWTTVFYFLNELVQFYFFPIFFGTNLIL